jgi:shikimate dehydrogenase
VWALAERGATSIAVFNRTESHAKQLVDDLGPYFPGVELTWGPLVRAETTQESYRVVVNATSLGHEGAAPRVHPDCYSRNTVAIELAYNPPETDFMVAARQAGARAENGLGMLVHQAALAFERWTGQVPPMDAFERAVKEQVAL